MNLDNRRRIALGQDPPIEYASVCLAGLVLILRLVPQPPGGNVAILFYFVKRWFFGCWRETLGTGDRNVLPNCFMAAHLYLQLKILPNGVRRCHTDVFYLSFFSWTLDCVITPVNSKFFKNTLRDFASSTRAPASFKRPCLPLLRWHRSTDQTTVPQDQCRRR